MSKQKNGFKKYCQKRNRKRRRKIKVKDEIEPDIEEVESEFPDRADAKNRLFWTSDRRFKK